MPRRPPAVARVLERVTKTAREHEMFAPGDLVLVSCSGGPDSVCLLYSLWHLRRLFKIRLAVFHFDHKLRPDAAKDALYVRRLAERLKLPFHLREADDAPLKGESVEAWAREARQAAARDVAEDVGAVAMAEGHTLDDQAETVLMAAIKGSGIHGLVGIWPTQGPDLARRVQPLIDVTREDVEAFCRALGLRPRTDPTNADTNFLRNAIRATAIPAIERATRREIRRPLARLADEIRPIALEQLTKPRSLSGKAPGERLEARGRRGDWFSISIGIFEHRSPLESKVVIRGWLKQMRLPVSKEAIDAILDLAQGHPGRRRDLPGGLKAVREKEYVRVSRSSPES
ncbi:MAG TPA: tRNA lysidine(34) synthetase TilS [Actinomycetota bacterium]|nr:tRNA lysidine(34) synthetase TilS [Actinomycetota bacterium]